MLGRKFTCVECGEKFTANEKLGWILKDKDNGKDHLCHINLDRDTKEVFGNW